jgi:DNA-directed RNA polymerase subunit RPC12/RpoP
MKPLYQKQGVCGDCDQLSTYQAQADVHVKFRCPKCEHKRMVKV